MFRAYVYGPGVGLYLPCGPGYSTLCKLAYACKRLIDGHLDG